MAYTRPGVYVKETPFTSNIGARSAATTAAFVGTAERGVTTPTLISSWNSYKTLYGEISDSYDLGYAIYHYFANGGRDAYVQRVVGANATNATIAFTGTVTGASAASTMFTLNATSVGTWGNNLRATIAFDTNTLDTGKINSTTEFSLIISLIQGSNTVEVERWQELSFSPASSRYYKSVLDLYSNYVRVQGTPATITTTVTPQAGLVLTFASGTAGDAIADANWFTGVDALATVNGPLLINLVGQFSSTRVNYALQEAYDRGDAFVIIDGDLAATTKNSIESAISGYSNAYGGFGAVYYPGLKMYDPAKTGPTAIRDTYCGGAIAGAFVRSETLRGVAKAPAGYTLDLQNVFGLVATLSDADQGDLYATSNVNVLRNIPGGGTIINGARTLAKRRPDKYITIRRTLSYLNTVLKDQTEFAVFEPNDDRLWDKIKVSLSSTLTDFWAKGNLKGNTADQAFYITCDASNNSAASIEDGYVNVEVGVALQYPAEFVVINLTQWAGGSTATTNL
jgi:phage tail sheath protein FI